MNHAVQITLPEQQTQVEVPTPLPDILYRNGFTYVLLHRGHETMLYEQRVGKTEDVRGYEVFRIIIDKPKTIIGKHIPARERFPKNEDFGYSAWAFRDLERARRKFLELETKGSGN